MSEPARQPLTISELTRMVKGLLEGQFPQGCCVTGEVSNLTRSGMGHTYFTLKDKDAQLRAVLYRFAAERILFKVTDGLEVIATGKLSVYVPRGEYQLLVDQLQPKGIGPLELAFQQLKEKLSREGYFDPSRKKPLPRFPRRIGIVTSPHGQAIRDVLEILGRRWPACEVLVHPVRVQGAGAAEDIARAIERLNSLQGQESAHVDVIFVGRGGGSLEDLWAFNEEPVARAIHASRIPIISGVGHETDLTISDLVADVRALTPSDAAVRLVPDRKELLDLLVSIGTQCRHLLTQRIDRARVRLQDLASRGVLRRPLEPLLQREQRLDEWGQRLQRAVKQRLILARQHLQAQSAQLETLSPLNVLARGYSLTRRNSDFELVRAARQVHVGDLLLTQVKEGQILSRVEEVREPAEPNPLASRMTDPLA